MEWILRAQVTDTQKKMANTVFVIKILVTFCIFFIYSPSSCGGAVILHVTPYPARVYTGAPPDVKVLTVHGYDNVTGLAIQDFRLETTNDASYFKIDSDGVISTNRTISFRVGKTFDFFVFGMVPNLTLDGAMNESMPSMDDQNGGLLSSILSMLSLAEDAPPLEDDIFANISLFEAVFNGSDLADYKGVRIVVSEENKLAPYFLNTTYNFPVYRYGVGDFIGQVVARDDDTVDYNSKTSIIADPFQASLNYVSVDSDGKIWLTHAVPEGIDKLDLIILAVDDGSPQRSGTTSVSIDVLMVKQPEKFCLSTTPNTTEVCWKNPMTEVKFDGYIISITGSIKVNQNLPEIGPHNEYCITIPRSHVGDRYLIRITINSTYLWYGDAFDLEFNKTQSSGHAKECENDNFTACSYLSPCNKNGYCTIEDSTKPLEYSCRCYEGYRGVNCSVRDLCLPSNPCVNNGSCTFLGNYEFKCSCPSEYYGNRCEYYKACLDDPCRNSGTCTTHSNGSFTCACADGFSGTHCEIVDPCSPSPCVADRGTCTRLSDTEYSCRCLTGYFGDRCEQVNACVLYNQPCRYSGTCVPNGTTYYCDCPPGTSGDNCENAEPCFIEPCLNGGSCSVGSNGAYHCDCPAGFVGNECQTASLCSVQKCGNGKCVADEKTLSARCECDAGYYGDSCEKYDICLNNPCGSRGECFSNGTADFKDSYDCQCNDDWYGPDCSYRNICKNNPCKNEGECVNTGRNQYLCKCAPGYYNLDCVSFNPCSLNECLNGARCRNLTEAEFECDCSEEWVGDRCQQENPCLAGGNPCLNGATCEVAPSETATSPVTASPSYAAVCHCVEGYLGNQCEFEDPCIAMPCQYGTCSLKQDGSVAVVTSPDDLYQCSCQERYTGKNCDVEIVSCEFVTCFNGGTCDTGSCICAANFTGTHCEDVVLPCVESHIGIMKCVCDNGEQICFEDNASLALRGLLGDTADPSKLTSSQVNNYTNVLLSLYNSTLNSPTHAKLAVTVLNNLGRVNVSVSEDAEKENQTNSKLREFLDNYASEADLDEGGGEVTIQAPEIQVQAMTVNRFVAGSGDLIPFSPTFVDNDTVQESNVTISLPRSIFTDAEIQSTNTRLQLIGYKRSQLFVPATGYPGYPLDAQHVVSATVKGKELRNLTEPVTFKLPKIRPEENHTCVYWDPENSMWSTEGVVLVEDDGSFITCSSTHLTSFAVLMDVSPDHQLSQAHQDALTYITYIGCAISLACLVMTILTYGLFKVLNQEKSGKILLHLCSALVLLNVTFLMGIVDVSSFSPDLCFAVGILLHYFLLAALMWMLMEAIEMYQALVIVFTKYERAYFIKRCLAAWGIPAVIVAITAAVDRDSYNSDTSVKEVCFLNSSNPIAYYVSLVAPACIIILINTVVFIMVARVILKPKFQQKKTNDSLPVTPAQVRGACTVMFLMGVTWVFGPLAINEAKYVFSYLFCICNSLQGCVIFIFRCLLNPEAKLAWLQLFHDGTLKRRRGPIKSISSDTYSKGNDHRRPSNSNNSGYQGSGSGTTRTTVSYGKSTSSLHAHPHQLHTTNGWHPNINGMRRDGGDRESSVVHGSSEYIAYSEKGRHFSDDQSVSSSRHGSIPDSSLRGKSLYQDQLTQF